MQIDLSDQFQLGLACERICTTLGVKVPPEVLEAYLRGEDRTLISYEKLEESAAPIPAIQKYLLAAESYRRQPALECYYDIFRCARIVPLVFALDRALQVVTQKVRYADERLARLTREIATDAFDAALFELMVAARYADSPSIRETAFIEETHKPQPDLRALSDAGPIYVECKRFDRSPNATIDLRLAARQKATIVLDGLRNLGISAVVDLVFKTNPANVSNEEIAHSAGVALRTRAPVESGKLRLDHRRITCGPFESFMLYPSPMYFAERYGFTTDGEWQGIVPQLMAKPAGPSFLDAVDWEAAVRWRIVDDALIWKMKRLGYSLLFKGLDQLAAPQDSIETVLHVNFERETPLGPRRKELLHFLETLRKQSKHTFGWTVFNELVINVSPSGRFDFVEHAHLLSGPKRTSKEPVVGTVFIPASAVRRGIGEFGVGLDLPPVDEDIVQDESVPSSECSPTGES